MDNPKTTTHIGLCAGYGGIELGLKRILSNLRTVALCEIEAFACANLVAKMEAGLMDAAPIWTDLKTFPWAEFRDRVDILTGGYPCQPFSAAGKRLRTEDERHLWPFIANGIRILKPRVCFFENVEGHISLGLREVIEELEQLGYEATFGIFSAAECGAPHQRKRVFILAYLQGAGLERYNGVLAGCSEPRRLTQRPQGQASRSDCCGDDQLADARHQQLPGRDNPAEGQQSGAGGISWSESASCYVDVWPARPGQPQYAWEPPRVVAEWEIKSTLGGNLDESSSGLDYGELSVSCDNRTDELRLLGNGVVPATAELAFRTLMQQL